MNNEPKIKQIILVGTLAIIIVISALWGLVWGMKYYSVWSAGMTGKAELARAEQNRKIKIYESEAKVESAKLEAQAEVERAKGVAEANKIIGNSLNKNENYLRYLYINNLAEGSNDVIYIPTEAGLPILEAGKR